VSNPRWRRVVGALREGGAVRGVATRLGWGVADQAMSSLTNFLVGVFFARALGPPEFGAFSIAFATYLIALNASRGLATDALMVRYSAVDPAQWRAGAGGATGTAVAVGVVGGIACAVAAMVIGSSTGAALFALGLTLPGLLLQDSWRFAFFAAGKPRSAFANDLLWALTFLVLFTADTLHGDPSVFSLMLAWGLAATVAALVAAVQSRLPPRVVLATQWLRRQRDLSSRYLGENLTIIAGTQLRFYGVAALVGTTAVGSLKAAELLLGPVNIMTLGISLMAVPEAVRLLRRSPPMLWTFCRRISILAASVAVVWGGALLIVLPDSLGYQVLGDSWGPASKLLLPTTLGVAALGIQIGAWMGVRALGAASRGLRSQALGSAMLFVGALVGAAAGGAAGAAWGSAAAAVVISGWWWLQFGLGLRAYRSGQLQALGPSRTAGT
jgi:O-antigen/teichoic acid export membrane protein